MSRKEDKPLLVDKPAITARWPELERLVRERTPARLLAGRADSAYTTAMQLRLRADHAAARDAVSHEFDLVRDLGSDFVRKHSLFLVSTQAASKIEYLMRPDLGRRLSEEAKQRILAHSCQIVPKLQIVVGDGLSVTAVAQQVPGLLPLLLEGASRRGWRVGQSFAIRYSRVGVLNDIGEVLSPAVVVLLIGERPGLCTAESLSAYMAFRPKASHTDADRNLISNIHARGVPPELAANRILSLAERMMTEKTSGTLLKEQLREPELSKLTIRPSQPEEKMVSAIHLANFDSDPEG